MNDVQTIMLFVGMMVALFAVWKPSVPSFLLAGTVNLVAVALYMF